MSPNCKMPPNKSPQFRVFLLAIILTPCHAAFLVQCNQKKSDFKKNNWTIVQGQVEWAESTRGLPEAFQEKLYGGDIFFFNLSRPEEAPSIVNHLNGFNMSSQKDTSLYIKYYALVGKSEREFFLLPRLSGKVGGEYHLLEPSQNLRWREEIVPLDMKLASQTGVEIGTFKSEGGYFLIESIIITQGHTFTSPKEMVDLCANRPRHKSRRKKYGKNLPSPTETEDAKESPEILKRESIPEEPLAKGSDEAVPDDYVVGGILHHKRSLSECIDNYDQFQTLLWSSYPPLKHVHDTNLLPEELKGKLRARGVMYFDGAGDFGCHVLFKAYPKQRALEDSHPIYLFLKYYIHALPNSNITASVQPVDGLLGNNFKNLAPTRHFHWKESILELNFLKGKEGTHNLVEISIQNIQPGEFFLVDKMVMARAEGFEAVLERIQDCLL